MARFQVRKRNGMWEVVVLRPGARAWQVMEQFFSWGPAMILATGQAPYDDGLADRCYRQLKLVWL